MIREGRRFDAVTWLMFVAVASSGGTVGCTPTPSASGPPGLASIRSSASTVVVRNHHGADLRIWVVAPDGTSYRLGIVPRLGVATLVLPRAIHPPATVMFVAIPFSSDEPQTSEPIIVDGSTQLVFTVAHDASVSTLVRRR